MFFSLDRRRRSILILMIRINSLYLYISNQRDLCEYLRLSQRLAFQSNLIGFFKKSGITG